MSERKTILITGSSSGLGRAAATKLASAGHRVILHGRDETKLQAAVSKLKASGAAVDSVTADLGSLTSVRAMAADVVERFGDLDVLINNAAISNWGTKSRQQTVDGHERIFATNYLSHYLLTRLVLPTLLQRPNPRIVNVGARQMGGSLDWEDLQMQHDFAPMKAVLHAKLGMFMLTRTLAKRYGAEGLGVAALDPGLVDTGYQKGANWVLRIALSVVGQPPERVAELYAWLAVDGNIAPEGRMYSAPDRPVTWGRYVADDANPERMWTESAMVVGL